MKKIITYILTIILAFTPVFYGSYNADAAENIAINSTNFPDAVFRKYISENFDLNGNGSLSTGEIEGATHIQFDCGPSSCPKDFTGIKFFTSLKNLSVPGMDDGTVLELLDVSGMNKLEYLECSYAKIKRLCATNCSKLSVLMCDGNQMQSLELSGCSSLSYIECDDNCLASLNLSGCKINYGNVGNQNVDVKAILTGKGWKIDLNELPGVNYNKINIQSKYLDGATFEKGVLLWENENDIPSTLTYEYSVPISSVDNVMDVTLSIQKGKLDINQCKIFLSQTEFTYSGYSNRPTATVTYDGDVIDSSNYTVTYSNNINAGNAAVTVKGTGNCEGNKTVYFTINPKELTESNFYIEKEQYYYTGYSITPVKINTSSMKSSDYIVKYMNNLVAGVATAQITGKNNYCGTVVLNFEIIPTDISRCQVSLSKEKYNIGEQPKVTIINRDGNIVNNTSYRIECSDLYSAGWKYAKVIGCGYGNSCYGTWDIQFEILEAPVATTIAPTPRAPQPTTRAKAITLSKAKITKIKNIKKKKVKLTFKNIKKKKVKLTFKNISSATGYQIKYSTSKQFYSAKTKNTKQTQVTIKVPKKKKYYFKIRQYIIIDGLKWYGPWSTVKSVKVKK